MTHTRTKTLRTSRVTQVASFYSRPPMKLGKTFKEQMEELNKKDPILNPDIYIGLPVSTEKKISNMERKLWKNDRKQLEQESRLQKLNIPLERVNEEWKKTNWNRDMHTIARHYAIFRDLFDNATFYPQPFLRIFYDYDEEFLTPVYNGNKILPSEAAVPPYVMIDVSSKEKNTLWTLVLLSPDGHLQDNTSEYLHWFVGNIPDGEIEKGDVICDYLQPFPVKGTGYHRYVFVLYKQEKKLDFSKELRSPKCKSLEERTFKNFNFYQKHQDDLTPASLAFFQCEWDNSVTQVFHDLLGMPEPSFEFIWPARYIPEQKKWPHKKPFNRYLDRYKDVKEIQEEVLKEKLKRTSPFKGPTPQPKYPNIYRIPMSKPKWLRTKIEKMRLGEEQWKDLYQ